MKLLSTNYESDDLHELFDEWLGEDKAELDAKQYKAAFENWLNDQVHFGNVGYDSYIGEYYRV